MLKLNIVLSNDMFAERKSCQVFAHESETLHRRRPNGIFHCENGEQKSPKPPLALARRRPHLIQQCIGPPHTPPQALTVEALSHTDAVGHNGAPQIRPQKYAFYWTDPQTPPPASSLDPFDLSCQTASGSDPPFLPQCTGQSDQPTDRQIVHGKV